MHSHCISAEILICWIDFKSEFYSNFSQFSNNNWDRIRAFYWRVDFDTSATAYIIRIFGWQKNQKNFPLLAVGIHVSVWQWLFHGPRHTWSHTKIGWQNYCWRLRPLWTSCSVWVTSEEDYLRSAVNQSQNAVLGLKFAIHYSFVSKCRPCTAQCFRKPNLRTY